MISASGESLPDPVALWRALRGFLRTSIGVVAPEHPEPRSRVTARITATNTAPTGPDVPAVVFYDVKLRLPERSSGHFRLPSPQTIPGSADHSDTPFPVSDREYGPVSTLRSGDSLVWEIECSFEDLPNLRPEVLANVSRASFFGTRQSVELPLDVMRPTVLRYVQGFAELQLGRTLIPALADIPAPGPATPFLEIRAVLQQLEESIQALGDAGGRIQSLSPLVRGPEAETHAKQAMGYMQEERKAREALRDAIGSADPQRIAVAFAGREKIGSLAAELDRVALELLRHYEIPEAEASGFRLT